MSSIVYVNSEQAKLLQLENVNKRDVVRACFYLGYGFVFTTELVSSPMRIAEAIDILDTAMSLGMSDEDKVEVRETGRTT